MRDGYRVVVVIPVLARTVFVLVERGGTVGIKCELS